MLVQRYQGVPQAANGLSNPSVGLKCSSLGGLEKLSTISISAKGGGSSKQGEAESQVGTTDPL